MPLDKLDIKIQEAARDFKPGSGEEAWLKMEKLLDVHMPQKESDRKRIAWLFLLLFSATAILLILIKTGTTEGSALSYPQENIISTLKNVVATQTKNQGDLKENIAGENRQEKNKPAISLSSTIKLISSTASQTNGKLAETKSGKTTADVTDKNEPGNAKNVDENNLSFKKNEEPFAAISSPAAAPSEPGEIKQPEKPDGRNKPDSTGKPMAAAAFKTNKKQGKNNNTFNNSFVLNFSAGPDVSAVNPGNIGKINPLYGAGIGYAIGRKWQLRSGFYVTKKAYKAEASDYHPPAQFWANYPDLEYIDANCKVYEVPLIVNYNFEKTSNHLWFGSVGVSSYFMKKEKYYYFPKDLSVQYAYDSYTINNKNKHFLSSLRLSGGYAATLYKNISIITEPYVNLPISGVGFGKVKLYSAGILFTLSVKPFAKK